MHWTYYRDEVPNEFSMPEWKVKTSSLIQFGILGHSFAMQIKHSGDMDKS